MQLRVYRVTPTRVLPEARPVPIGFLFFLLILSMFLQPSTCRGIVPLPMGDKDYQESADYIFLEDELPLIEVTLDSALFEGFLADPWQDDYQRCTVRFRNSLIDETLYDVGIRVRGYTSRNAIKKSWKLSFNKFVKGRKFHGLEKMNINGDVDDISFIRSRLMWKHFKKMGVPSARSHHVRLKINDGSEVEGVFIQVEQVDEEMIEAWFGSQKGSLYKCLYKNELADLRWVDPGDGDTYRDLGEGEVYSEKLQDSPSYEDLADFIDFINHADDEVFASELVDRFGVDGFLRSMAVDVVTGNWDGYWFGANNFYLYHDPETDRFEYIPHDMDDTYGIDYFGIDWATRHLEIWGDDGIASPDGELPPLIARVLDIPVYEGQLKYYIREFSDGPFSLPQCEGEIDRIREMILPYVLEGSYRNGRMDRGYTKIMFIDSYTKPTSFVGSRDTWDYGLKPFITDRCHHLSFNVMPPSLRPDLWISEILPVNRRTDVDESGERAGWIEIHNDWVADVNLGGMYLSDNPRIPKKWQIPAGVTLRSGEFLRFWCDGQPEEGPLHTGFRFDGERCVVGLFHNDENRNILIDFMDCRESGADISICRLPGSPREIFYSDVPSAGAPNIFSGNLPPLIDRVEREPFAPDDDEPVLIRARVRDFDGEIGSVVLHFDDGGKIIEYEMTENGITDEGIFTVEVPALPEGRRVEYWFTAEDDSGVTGVSPAGAPAAVHGYSVGALPPRLCINELMAVNALSDGDRPEETGGWVEIYNPGSSPVRMKGMTLSDTPAFPDLYTFPDIELEPGGFLIVRCDGTLDPEDLQAGFTLLPSADRIGLFTSISEGSLPIDTLHFLMPDPGRSYTRQTDCGTDWIVTAAPTPGKSNFMDASQPDRWSDDGHPLMLWPNPVRLDGSSTTIGFRLDQSAHAIIKLYNAAGRERGTILDTRLGPGERFIQWKPGEENRGRIAPGVYFLRLDTEDRHESVKIILVP